MTFRLKGINAQRTTEGKPVIILECAIFLARFYGITLQKVGVMWAVDPETDKRLAIAIDNYDAVMAEQPF